MAKKGRINRVKDERIFRVVDNIEKRIIGEYNTEYMKIFGINVIMARQIPSDIDGLKSVERRILYSIYRVAKNKQIKMGKAISACMDIHPHGDQSIYSTIVRLGQPWQNMCPTIDSCGESYGNIKGDDAAAPRYLSAKLTSYAIDCFFSDFDESIVDMIDSYDELSNIKEPLFLPAKYPNVLINNATGMAFGVATNIPSYNVKELLEYTIKLIKNPNCKGYLIPDTPTDCLIVNDEEIFKSIHETGRGPCGKKDGVYRPFRMRGEIEIDDENHVIQITSVPFQVNFKNIKNIILELKEKKIINGMTQMSDNSGENHIDLKLYFKKEVDLNEISNIIYKKTYLEDHYPAQIKVIDDFSVKHHSVRSLLLRWLDHRRDFKRRYYNMKIVTSKAREHTIDIILYIFNEDNAEKTLKMMKKSEDKKETIVRLIDMYKIDSLKAEAIANMRMHEFTKASIRNYRAEKEELVDDIAKYKKLVNNVSKIDDKIIEELEKGIKKYGVPRRSKIITIADKDVIPDTKHILVFTKNGYVKKLKHDINKIGTIAQDDEPIDIINVNNKDEVMIFDNLGRVHNIPVHTIQGCELNSIGYSLDKYARIENGKIVSIFIKDEWRKLKNDIISESSDTYFLFTSRLGLIKKTPYDNYLGLKNSVIGSMVKKDDDLISVKHIKNDTDIIVFTYKGYGLRFNSTDISETKRMSLGVKAFSIEDDDGVCDTSVVRPGDKYLFMVTSKGCVKKCLLSNLQTEDRRNEASKLIGLEDGEYLSHIFSVTDKDKFRVFLKSEIIDINVSSDVPELYRLNKGKKLIPIKKGDMIVKIKRI